MNLEEELALLERAQLVRLLVGEEYEYLFKHALTHEAAYRSLLIKTRRELNRRVAEIFESLYPDRLDEYASILAHYYAESGDIGQAVQYLMRAGDRALRVSAYPEAIQTYEKALGLVPADAGGERATLLVRLGEVYDRRS